MALQHYLPATYIALFSAEDTLPRRTRKLFAGDRREAKIIQAPASKLGGIHDFYTLESSRMDSDFVDEVWTDYESHLVSAIQNLIDGSIDAISWARTLVPFVTGLLLRGPDFNLRFDHRIRRLGIDPTKDNVNVARILELQRLLGPVTVAEWIVARVQGDGKIITNDLGFAPFVYGPTGELGISIPISHSHLLQIIPRRSRRLAVARNAKWFPRIKYLELVQDSQHGFNVSSGRIAQRFIFAPFRHLIEGHLYQVDRAPPVPEPSELGFISGPLAVVHEFTWHRLVSAISRHPEDHVGEEFKLDLEVLEDGWFPPMILPTNLPEFGPCLKRKGNIIEASFYEVDGFTR